MRGSRFCAFACARGRRFLRRPSERAIEVPSESVDAWGGSLTLTAAHELLDPCTSLQNSDVSVKDGGGCRSNGNWSAPRTSDFLRPLRDKWLSRFSHGDLLRRCSQTLPKPVAGSEGPQRFSDSEIAAFRADLCCFLRANDFNACTAIAPGQPFCLSLFEGVLRAICDVDTALPSLLADGVTTGIFGGVEPSGVWPRTANVNTCCEDVRTCDANWCSAADFPELTQELLDAEVKVGFLEEWFGTLDDARAQWPLGIAVSKLAVVQAAGKDPRLVVDATAAGLNPRAHFPERAENPTIAEVKHLIASHYDHHPSEPLVAITIDVKSAHKRVLIREAERGFQFVNFNSRLFYYKTAHFGGKWSAWWWARVGAALHRILHVLIHDRHYGVIYVDDFLFLVPESSAAEVAALIQACLVSLGCPISWHKVKIGPCVEYLGFTLNVRDGVIGIPQAKVELAREFLDSLRKGNYVSAKAIERGRGRLLWFTWVALALRPWLAPFFQCCSQPVRGSRVRVTAQLATAAAFWRSALANFSCLHKCVVPQSLGGTCAADACASASGASLGGWWLAGGQQEWSQLRWFRLELDMNDVPDWMRPQVSAHERIAFFELLAQVVLLYLRLRETSHVVGSVALHLRCDNSGAVGAVRKFFTTKSPLSFGLQALAWHCAQASAVVTIDHLPGKANELADQISRWRRYPDVIARLPPFGECTDFSLASVLGPVWDFAADSDA